MRKPATIRKYIEKTEAAMYARTKARRVSAGALNRDISSIGIRLEILRGELKRSLEVWQECESCMGSGSADCDRGCFHCEGLGRVVVPGITSEDPGALQDGRFKL
jgi:hypothetical protein